MDYLESFNLNAIKNDPQQRLRKSMARLCYCFVYVSPKKAARSLQGS